jgi:hypothetical protein
MRHAEHGITDEVHFSEQIRVTQHYCRYRLHTIRHPTTNHQCFQLTHNESMPTSLAEVEKEAPILF